MNRATVVAMETIPGVWQALLAQQKFTALTHTHSLASLENTQITGKTEQARQNDGDGGRLTRCAVR